MNPSVYALTQFQPQHLPMDFRAETYFQGGYVDDHFTKPFVDGQVRVDRKLFQFGNVELRGGGIWGGAQKGAQRLDVGPGMSVYFGNGTVHSRLSLDYRFRVAGDAAPASVPALTLSAGF